MEDLPNLLQRDYGLKPQGKSAPMSASRSSTAGFSSSTGGHMNAYDDVFGGPPKFTTPSFASQSEGYDDIFRSFSTPINTSSVPVFDAPVYDDDIFGGLKGVRSATVTYDDVFSGGSGGGPSASSFEDLLGEFGAAGKPSTMPNSQRSRNQGDSGFDDLIPGFGNSQPTKKTRLTIRPTNLSMHCIKKGVTAKLRGNHNKLELPKAMEIDVDFGVEKFFNAVNKYTSTTGARNIKHVNGLKDCINGRLLDKYPMSQTSLSLKLLYGALDRGEALHATLDKTEYKMPRNDFYYDQREVVDISKTTKSPPIYSRVWSEEQGACYEANTVRSAAETRPKQRGPTGSPRKPPEDPFVVLESESLSTNASSNSMPDPFDQFNMPSHPTSAKERKASSNGTAGIDGINAFDGFTVMGRATSSPMNTSRIARSPLKTSHSASPIHASGSTDSLEGRSVRKNSVNNNPVKDHAKSYAGVPRADLKKVSVKSNASSKISSPRRDRQPLHENSPYVSNLNSQGSSPSMKSEKGANFVDEILVTVNEIKLLTQPTKFPPPSRPPPPLVIKQGPSSKKTMDSKAESYSDTSVLSKTISTHQQYSQHHHSRKASGSSAIQELDDFVSGGPQVGGEILSPSIDEEVVQGSSAAAASTAAMKEAMERAEAKLKLAKEARERKKEDWEREAKTGKSKEKERQERRDARTAQETREREEKEREVKAAREAREQEEWQREEQEKERRQREREREKEKEREREREREKDRIAVERATQEAQRAAAEARLRAERAAVERANAEARERAAERAAVERAAAEARERAERAVAERAAAAARERQRRSDNDLESFFGMGARPNSAPKQRPTTLAASSGAQSQNKGFSSEAFQKASTGTPPIFRQPNVATNTADDWTSLFRLEPLFIYGLFALKAVSSSEEFQEVPGESAERRRARLERHQRTLERAAKALAEKNDRDLQAQREQAEKHVSLLIFSISFYLDDAPIDQFISVVSKNVNSITLLLSLAIVGMISGIEGDPIDGNSLLAICLSSPEHLLSALFNLSLDITPMENFKPGAVQKRLDIVVPNHEFHEYRSYPIPVMELLLEMGVIDRKAVVIFAARAYFIAKDFIMRVSVDCLKESLRRAFAKNYFKEHIHSMKDSKFHGIRGFQLISNEVDHLMFMKFNMVEMKYRLELKQGVHLINGHAFFVKSLKRNSPSSPNYITFEVGMFHGDAATVFPIFLKEISDRMRSDSTEEQFLDEEREILNLWATYYNNYRNEVLPNELEDRL
eukprot:Gb_26456 [translate_table: standard]